jgi:hypothetical protein
MSILNGVATAGSILSSVMGGQARASELRNQAKMSEIDAGAQALESERRALDIRKKAMQAQAANSVAFASSGIDSMIGTPADINAGIATDAAYNVGTEEMNARHARERGSIAAAGYRKAAGNAALGGIVQGLLSGTKYAIGSANRGAY